MSKLQTYECEMKDKSLLLDAVTRLGWTVTASEYVLFYSGKGQVCDLVLNFADNVVDRQCRLLSRKYNIGVNLDSNGQIKELLFDNAMNGQEVRAQTEQDDCTKRVIGSLKQAYQLSAAKRVALRKGYRVKEIAQADGSVQLVTTGRW